MTVSKITDVHASLVERMEKAASRLNMRAVA